jgi:TfoX/Sxy family transcriptional regulator of competence genes
MAYDENLASRLRTAIAKRSAFTEKKMFGGLAIMVDEKMCCGVLENYLVARIGPDNFTQAIKLKNVRPMDFTGKPMKGYVYVNSKGLLTSPALQRWVDMAFEFTKSVKQKPSKKRVTVSEIESEAIARTTPLSRLINFGPVTRKELESIGISMFGHLEDLGWEEVCRRWVTQFPERLNVNAFTGIIATLEGMKWTKVTESEKAPARRLVNELRIEIGVPLVKKPRKRKRL